MSTFLSNSISPYEHYTYDHIPIFLFANVKASQIQVIGRRHLSRTGEKHKLALVLYRIPLKGR